MQDAHKPGDAQYMMDGEYGNLEFWIKGHTWTNASNTSEVCRADLGRFTDIT